MLVSRIFGLGLAVTLIGACSSDTGGTGTSTESTETSGDAETTESGGTTGSSGDESSGETADFIDQKDMAVDESCEPLPNECPEGQKCSPYGDTHWEDFHCVDLDPNAKPPGSKCTVEGGRYSGIDDCDETSTCLMGIGNGLCLPYCNEWVDDCGEGSRCISISGTVPVCVDECDVVAQDCLDGAYCIDGGLCFPGEPYGSGYGEPCTMGFCQAGLHCRPAAEIGQCDDTWCCTQLCWADDPNGADVCPEQGQTCEPLDPDGLGYCALP